MLTIGELSLLLDMILRKSQFQTDSEIKSETCRESISISIFKNGGFKLRGILKH